MIKLPTGYKKVDKAKEKDSKLKSPEKSNVFDIVKDALAAFREQYDLGTNSHVQKNSELKINFIVKYVRERLQEVEFEDFLEDEGLTLSSEERDEISKILEDKGGKFSTEEIESVLSQIEEILEKSSAKKVEGLAVRVDDDLLLDVFDKLYKNGSRFKDLKEDISKQIYEDSDRHLALFRERMEKYRSHVLSQNKTIGKLVEKIEELSVRDGMSKKDKDQLNQIKEGLNNNLIEKNLLTQKIVEQVRRNEHKDVKEEPNLSPLHKDYAEKLVDKFYRNGKFELQWKRFKFFQGKFMKIMNKFVFGPIWWILKGIWKITLNTIKNVYKLSAYALRRTAPIWMTPAGAWTLGFVSGLVCHWVYDHLIPDWLKRMLGLPVTDEEKDNFSIWRFITNLMKPLEAVWSAIKWMVKFIADHPVLISTVVAIITGLIGTFKHLGAIKTGFTIVKKGWKFAGSMLLGIGASVITEKIFSSAVWKFADEDGMKYAKGSMRQYQQFSGEFNMDTYANMNSQARDKYDELSRNMDNEFELLSMMTSDLEKLQNFRSDSEQGKYRVSDILTRNFIDNVFHSDLFGDDEEGKNRYLSEFEKMQQGKTAKTLSEQSEALLKHIATRFDRLNKMRGVLSQASKNGTYDLIQHVEHYTKGMKDGKIDDGVIEKLDNKNLEFHSSINDMAQVYETWSPLGNTATTGRGSYADFQKHLSRNVTESGYKKSYNGKDTGMSMVKKSDIANMSDDEKIDYQRYIDEQQREGNDFQEQQKTIQGIDTSKVAEAYKKYMTSHEGKSLGQDFFRAFNMVELAQAQHAYKDDIVKGLNEYFDKIRAQYLEKTKSEIENANIGIGDARRKINILQDNLAKSENDLVNLEKSSEGQELIHNGTYKRKRVK